MVSYCLMSTAFHFYKIMYNSRKLETTQILTSRERLNKLCCLHKMGNQAAVKAKERDAAYVMV